MSEYWDPNEYIDDDFIEKEEDLIFDIKIHTDHGFSLPDNYLYFIDEADRDFQGCILSMGLHLITYDGGDVSVETDGRKSCFIIHRDLFDLLKQYFPFLYNVVALPLLRVSEEDRNYFYKFEDIIVSLKGLFYALNNAQTKSIIERYLQKKYGVSDITIAFEYEACYELDEFDYGGTPIWKEQKSFGRVFPCSPKTIPENIVKNVWKLGFDLTDFLFGYYLYASGGVRNVKIETKDTIIFIYADMYEPLLDKSSDSDFQEYKHALNEYSGDSDWVNDFKDIAVYFAILEDGNLKKQLKQAQITVKKLAATREQELEKARKLEEQRRKEEENKKREEEALKKLATEQVLLQERQERGGLKRICQRVETALSVSEKLYVRHDEYGAGEIKQLKADFSMEMLTVEFKGGVEKVFTYPSCFLNILSLISGEDYRKAEIAKPKAKNYWDDNY